jgi:predicted small secreted protein
MSFTEVRAVADLARAEEWDDIYSVAVPSLQEKNCFGHVGQDIKHIGHDIKDIGHDIKHLGQYVNQVRLSHLMLIGLAGIVGVAALVTKHRKS